MKGNHIVGKLPLERIAPLSGKLAAVVIPVAAISGSALPICEPAPETTEEQTEVMEKLARMLPDLVYRLLPEPGEDGVFQSAGMNSCPLP